jgi:alpha-beta hydrolase superfamily lysophospholipase
MNRYHVRTVTFTTQDGVELYGALFGSGRAGVVLSNDVPHPLCEVVPPAVAMARRGYRVIVFDYRGHGESEDSDAAGRLDLDVLAADEELRRTGVEHVVLMGSYGGAAAAIVAAAEADLPVDGLVGISPAPQRGQYIGGPFDPMGALQAAPRLDVPVLYVTAESDGNLPVSEVRRLYDATGSEKDLVVVDDLPSWYLLRYDARAAGAVFGFVRDHT